MVTKPISQIIAVSDEDGIVRLKVNPDGSINVTTTGGGTTPEMNIAEVGGVTVPAYGGTFPTSGLPVAFISSAGSTMQPAVVSPSGAQRMDIYEVGDIPLMADGQTVGTPAMTLPVGGVHNTTSPIFDDGDRVQTQFTNRGELITYPSGATTTSRLLSSAATTNATNAKAAAGRLFTIIGFNTNAAVRYLKIYNKATAPTVGTDTPVLTIPLVPSSGFTIDLPQSLTFTLGIGFALTTGSADADTGAVGAGDIVGLNLVFS